MSLSAEPLVSIVTPSFNQAAFLEQTIQSVLNQDYAHIEYIIMDGGSQDGSAEIIQTYSQRLAFWQSRKDGGQTDAINQGFAKAHGEILAWLNSDDLLYSGAVSKAVAALRQYSQAVMVYGNCDLVNGQGKFLQPFPAAQTDLQKLRQGYVHIPQQASFFLAEAWRQVGPLDPSFFFAMDYDLWTRLASLGPLQYVNAEPWAAFRLHGDSKSIAADDRCWPEMLRVHYRDGGKPVSPIVAKYWVRKCVQPVRGWLRKKRLEK
ncbi:MAG: glycosyltransferase family 2 protein [Anaerolineaceae bacterium]|nr:glycosyltransferase family 2 protein [Anaerolineaceae bacterium]